MEANTANRAAPEWRALYEAAVLELDPKQMPERIAQAERAIMNCMEDLNRSDGSESEALLNALNVVRDLRRMLDSDGKAQQ
jgi:hypothetical protein